MRRPGWGRHKPSSLRLAYPLVFVSFVLFVFYYNVLSGMSRTDYNNGGQMYAVPSQGVASNSDIGAKRPDTQALSHQPHYLLNMSWSPDPMLSLIKTDLYLKDDMNVFMMQPKPDYDLPEGNIIDYLMLAFIEHPRVILVDNKDDADILLSVTAWTNESATLGMDEDMRQNPDWSRVVIIDEVDHFESARHVIYNEGRYLAYFKRSFAHKNYSDPVGIDRIGGPRDLSYSYWPKKHNFYGFSYGVTDRYLRSLWDETNLMAYDHGESRNIPVLCTLRHNTLTEMGGRNNIKLWLLEMNIPGAQVDVVDAGGRGSPSTGSYWQSMKSAQIVAHANPGNWEGDFRLWESLCSKALVFVDYIYAPFPHPLIDGEDVVFFDPLDKEAFVKKVLYYLENKEEARKIAMNGFYKAVKYHRYINRVDYMLNTVNLITDPAYKNSGMHLKETMMRSDKHFFKPVTETEKAFTDYTVGSVKKEMAQKPSDRMVHDLKKRLNAKKTYWDKWIKEKDAVDAKLKAEKDEEIRLYWETRIAEEKKKREEEEKHKTMEGEQQTAQE